MYSHLVNAGQHNSRSSCTRRRFAVSVLGLLSLATNCGERRARRVAVLPKTTAIDYWENLHDGALSSASSLGFHILWNAPESETNFAQQAFMLEDFIRQRVDAVVLAPSHGSVLASAVRHAKAEGIPLVVVDSPVMVDAREYEAFIGSDAESMGRLAAMRMGQILNGSGDVAVLGVSPTVEAAVRRERAFTSSITSHFPGVRVAVVRYGLSDAVRTRELVSDLLGQSPRISAIFASDTFAVRGTLIALRGYAKIRPKLIGVAQETDLLPYVDRGLIDSLIVQDPYSMGRAAVRIIGDVLNGGYDGPRVIQTQVALATRENLNTAQIRELTSRLRPLHSAVS